MVKIKTFFWMCLILCSCVEAQKKSNSSSLDHAWNSGMMRDSIFYQQHDEEFNEWRETLKDSILASSDSILSDFWTHEMLLLLDTFSNKLSAADKNQYFNALTESLDTSDYHQLSFVYIWLEFLEKKEFTRDYYPLLVSAAKKSQERTGDLSLAYEYATLVRIEDEQTAFEIIDSCYQLYGDTLYVKWLWDDLKNALNEP